MAPFKVFDVTIDREDYEETLVNIAVDLRPAWQKAKIKLKVCAILLTGSPAKFGHVLLYSPCLFGKKLFSILEKFVNSKQTRFLKQNFSDTITQILKRCVMSMNR